VGLNGRETLAAHATPVAQDGPATLAPLARQKAVLPFAPDLRRLILSFHKLICFVAAERFVNGRSVFGNNSEIGTQEVSSERLSVNRSIGNGPVIGDQ
jgi:hypothetical protein